MRALAGTSFVLLWVACGGAPAPSGGTDLGGTQSTPDLSQPSKTTVVDLGEDDSGTATSPDQGGGSTPDMGKTMTSDTFGVRVSGNHLVDLKTGKSITLHGMSVSGLEQGFSDFQHADNYGPKGPDFAAMASWHMDVVRIPLNEATWLGINTSKGGNGGNCTGGAQSATVQTLVKNAVAAANAAGLYAILDLHWAAPNEYGCPIGQGAMPDKDNSANFWTSVATMFKDNPAVMFELFNEPFGSGGYDSGAWKMAYAPGTDVYTLLNGGSYPEFEYQNNLYDYNTIEDDNVTFDTVGMQTLVDTVRATGATNVIISNCIGWAGEIEMWLGAQPVDPLIKSNPTLGNQIAAGWHAADPANTDAAALVLKANYPIIVTEAYSIGALMNWADTNSVSVLYWAWLDWDGANGVLSNAQTSTPGTIGLQLQKGYACLANGGAPGGCW